MSNGTTTWTYTYDANGMRTKRTNGTTTYSYVYNGSQLVQMTVGNDILYFTYDAYGLPMTVTHNGTLYYYVTNIQGDVLAILDSTGSAVAWYTHDAWGNEIPYYYDIPLSTIRQLNPLRYRGYVYDTETDLYYLQSRYYNPEWGRFLNADGYTTTGQGLLGNNMFAYCLNNPLRYVDHSGKIAIEITLTAAGTIAGVVICGVALAHFAAKAISTFLDWLASQWYYRFAQVTYKTQKTIEAQVNTYSEHTKNISEKNRNKHEEANARRQRDQGGEKKKQKKEWKSNNNKRRLRNIDGTF